MVTIDRSNDFPIHRSFQDESDPNAKRRKTEEVNETLVRIPLNTGSVDPRFVRLHFLSSSLQMETRDDHSSDHQNGCSRRRFVFRAVRKKITIVPRNRSSKTSSRSIFVERLSFVFQYLAKKKLNNLDRANFTFSSKVHIGHFHQPKEGSDGKVNRSSPIVRIASSRFAGRFSRIYRKRNRRSNSEDESEVSSISL